MKFGEIAFVRQGITGLKLTEIDHERLIKVKLIGAKGNRFQCVLEEDDCWASSKPNKKGDIGWWNKDQLLSSEDLKIL